MRALTVLLLLYVHIGIILSSELPRVPIGLGDLNSTLLWGTYRPSVYFGTKTRDPTPLITGIMWVSHTPDPLSSTKIRHTCEESDKLGRYGWLQHDGKNYGVQEIIDRHNNLNLTTIFVKKDQNWSARITGFPDNKVIQSYPISLMFYIGGEDDQVNLHFGKKPSKKGLSSEKIYLHGNTAHIGHFTTVIQDSTVWSPTHPEPPMKSKHLKDLEKTHFIGSRVPSNKVWTVKDSVSKILSANAFQIYSEYISNKNGQEEEEVGIPVLFPTLPNTMDESPNLVVFQKVLEPPFEIEINFITHDADKKSHLTSEEIEQISEEISGTQLTTLINTYRSQFETRFEDTFGLGKKGYSTQMIKFAMASMSNLIGGIGFWFGDSLVKSTEKGLKEAKYTHSSQRALMSAVPSRPFFPRGFLWDEGFHQLIVNLWDSELSMEIVAYWFNTMDHNGWIQREQILGDEARSKVPTEFQVQNPIFANPPTILFPIASMLKRYKEQNGEPKVSSKDSGVIEYEDHSQDSILPSKTHTSITSTTRNTVSPHFSAFLEGIYPRLEANFKWFNKTQKGKIPFTFRWRGRTENHTLTSGLDDYPRGLPPSDSELHVDLLSWMATYSELMGAIATHLNKDATPYQALFNKLQKSLEENHWSPSTSSYCDVGLWPPQNTSTQLLCHDGYISLFPFLLGVLPKDSPHLVSILQLIKDPQKLWSEYGLRSLSMLSPFFGKDENYWRGPIWMNINYLTLRALKTNCKGTPHEGECNNIYKDLRERLVNNLFKVYKDTGYLWEQYHPLNGSGQRSHPFTGWSALVLLIMSEIY
eukprot:TRINITY_DN1496_c0_g2_i1.p1 TRINITY_DN1496_c0_g2~~TRINITY_DN1496_c0_g2_i1.p1  ORF type:complete len:812 (-),score=157.66 TRINITY_DN1496_c0_g2_i1:58-2493(-)